VRDAGGVYEENGPFSQRNSKVQPCGTIARTGNGWLEGAAGDGPHVVRMELDVLDLPAERRIRLIMQRDHDRFCAFAADLVSVAMWNGSMHTFGALAERTLVPEADLRATLVWAERHGLVHRGLARRDVLHDLLTENRCAALTSRSLSDQTT
jgi:hypothetical protein